MRSYRSGRLGGRNYSKGILYLWQSEDPEYHTLLQNNTVDHQFERWEGGGKRPIHMKNNLIGQNRMSGMG